MKDRPLSDLIRHRDPVTMPPDATVQDACARMREKRVGCVLVVEDGDRLVGIFTGRDAVCRIGADCRDPRTTLLRDAMTQDPAHLPAGAGALDALRLMQDGGFRHVPLVEGGRVVGIVSRGDFRAMEHVRLNEETDLWERI